MYVCFILLTYNLWCIIKNEIFDYLGTQLRTVEGSWFWRSFSNQDLPEALPIEHEKWLISVIFSTIRWGSSVEGIKKKLQSIYNLRLALCRLLILYPCSRLTYITFHRRTRVLGMWKWKPCIMLNTHIFKALCYILKWRSL